MQPTIDLHSLQPMAGSSVVLLACGSFNPPTYMHLRMFEIARDYLTKQLGCHVIEGIMSPVCDSYGKPGLVAAHHRLKMLQLALRSSDWIRPDSWESDQGTYQRTALCLKHHELQLRYRRSGGGFSNGNMDSQVNDSSAGESGSESSQPQPTSRGAKVMLLCGADLLSSFLTPNLWSTEDMVSIVRDHGMVVVGRAGVELAGRVLDSNILRAHHTNVHIIHDKTNPNECSSTKIRLAIREGLSVKYLVEDSVYDYIRQHSLYNSDSITNSTSMFELPLKNHSFDSHSHASTSLSSRSHDTNTCDGDERSYETVWGGATRSTRGPPTPPPPCWAPSSLIIDPIRISDIPNGVPPPSRSQPRSLLVKHHLEAQPTVSNASNRSSSARPQQRVRRTKTDILSVEFKDIVDERQSCTNGIGAFPVTADDLVVNNADARLKTDVSILTTSRRRNLTSSNPNIHQNDPLRIKEFTGPQPETTV